MLDNENAEISQEWLSDLFDADNLTNRVLSGNQIYSYSLNKLAKIGGLAGLETKLKTHREKGLR